MTAKVPTSPPRRAAPPLEARSTRGQGSPLTRYRSKRDFALSPEPKGRPGRSKGDGDSLGFVVQKHAARRLHYDLRLELDGVLLSWAVTRGPSLVAGERRLAVHTEDHPLDYLAFEGVIPEGEYGGGTMVVWDQGRWIPQGDPRAAYAKGHLAFALEGERLRGRWHLVRTRPVRGKEQWLLLKSNDEHARDPSAPDVLEEHVTSLLSGRTVEELAAAAGAVRPDHAGREAVAARGRESAPTSLAGMAGAKKGILPPFVEPCLASLGERAPEGAAWWHEIKYDGYRLQARVDGLRVQLLTRSGLDWTGRFGTVADAIRHLTIPSALIDGELVVEDEAGRSDFAALTADLEAGRTDRLVYYAFDLLYVNGRDLREASLRDRKAALAALLDDPPASGRVRLSQHLEGNGGAMARHACRLGLEGIVAKRADRPCSAAVWMRAARQSG